MPTAGYPIRSAGWLLLEILQERMLKKWRSGGRFKFRAGRTEICQNIGLDTQSATNLFGKLNQFGRLTDDSVCGGRRQLRFGMGWIVRLDGSGRKCCRRKKTGEQGSGNYMAHC